MELMSQEPVLFEDVLCQVHDMLLPGQVLLPCPLRLHVRCASACSWLGSACIIVRPPLRYRGAGGMCRRLGGHASVTCSRGHAC